MAARPVQIAPRFVERVWGSHDLSPLFPRQEKKVGEVWFNEPDNSPLLIKFIFDPHYTLYTRVDRSAANQPAPSTS